MERNTFRNNDADDDGGALYFDDGSASMHSNTFSGNSPDDCYKRDRVVMIYRVNAARRSLRRRSSK